MIDYRITMEVAMKPESDRETQSQELVEADVSLDSVTLARLLAEVRNNEKFEPGMYNRQHNRHNR